MVGRITVVVATRDRCERLMESLPHHESPVILVDNGSTDGTGEEVRRRFPHVQLVELGENRGAVARNVGVEMARTPYVAFADDDSWWAPGALERAADLLDEQPRTALLAARVLVGPEERLDPLSAELAASPLPAADVGPSILGFLACAAVVRREAFLAVGGFDDVIFFFGEEERVSLDLAAAGWQLAYVEELVAHHHPSPSRESSERTALALRNALLTAVMRRPWPVVARRTATTVRQGPAGREALLSTLPRLPGALRCRRRLPPEVEAARLLLDNQCS